VLIVGSADAVSPANPLFHRIVCAADLTQGSQAVLDTALSVAAESLARVTLLHVLDGLPALSVSGPFRPTVDLAEVQMRMADQAREQLIEAARPARDFCEVSERVETGKAWQEIIRVAEDIEADLIVMGSRSQAGLDRLFLGSTVNQVVRQAPCPVLVVRGP
jgi:universal stress protein A